MTLLRPQRQTTALAPSGSTTGTLWAVAAALWVAGFSAVNATAGMRGTYELWWETRQGLLTLASGHAVLQSSWSWTAGGQAWIPNSWGWGVLLAIAYRLGGLGGTVVFVLLVQAAVCALAWWLFGLLGVGRGPLRLGLLVLLCLTMSGWASGRSELADYLCVFGFAAACLHPALGRRGARWRTAALAASAVVLAAVWENLHLGGLAAVPVFAAVYLICGTAGAAAGTRAVVGVGGTDRGGIRLAQRAAMIAAGACLGVLLTPSGTAGILKSLGTASTSRAEHYAAWGAIFAQPGSYNYEPVVLALGVGLAAVVLALRRRNRVVAAILLVSALLSCAVVRSGSDLVMLALISGSGMLSARFEGASGAGGAPGAQDASRRWMPRWRIRRPELLVAGAASVWLVVAIVIALAAGAPLWRLTGVDPADLSVVPSGARIYSTISASDAIDLLRPDLQVTLDSRNDLYPVELYEFVPSLRHANVRQAPDWFADNHVTAVYLPGGAAAERRTALARELLTDRWQPFPEAHGLVLLAPGTHPAA